MKYSNFKRKCLYTSLSAIIAGAVSVPAMAEDNDVTAFEEIIVTSQKRAQRLSDVPISITALTEDNLTRMGAADFIGYQASVAGLSMDIEGPSGDQRGGAKINIRGLSSTVGSDTVGFYIDETPIPFSNPELFDIERIEVLRGPQGTLYGSGSMGGTIRMISNKPNLDETEGKISASGSFTQDGGFNLGVNGMVNVPLVEDKVAARIVVMSRDDSGYIDNVLGPRGDIESEAFPGRNTDTGHRNLIEDVNTENLKAIRAAVTFKASEELTITPSVYYQNLDIGGEARSMVTFGDAPLGDHETTRPDRNDTEDTFALYDLTVEYDMGFADFTSSTSYYKDNHLNFIDGSVAIPFLTNLILGGLVLPGVTVPGFPMTTITRSAVFTEEARITSSGDDALQWMLGAFYQDSKRTSIQDWSYDGFNDLVFGAPVISNDTWFAMDQRNNSKNFAIFGQLIYNVTEDLTVTGGLRWFDMKTSFTRAADGFFQSNGTLNIAGSSSHNGFTPRINVSYDISEDMMVYATASKGFRPGFAFSKPGDLCDDEILERTGVTADELGSSVDPDTLWSYEAGVKASLADKRVQINASVYHMKWNDIQQTLPLACGFTVTINAGAATSSGFEGEVTVYPVDDLAITAAVSYTDAKLSEDVATLGAVKGDRLLNVSDWKVALSGTYSFDVSDEVSGYARVDYQYSGDALRSNSFDPENEAQAFMNIRPSYHNVNARLAFFYNDWEFAIYGKNLTNQKPRLGVQQFITPEYNVYTGRPRTIGMSVSRDF